MIPRNPGAYTLAFELYNEQNKLIQTGASPRTRTPAAQPISPAPNSRQRPRKTAKR